MMASRCVTPLLKHVILSVTALGLIFPSESWSIPFGANYGASTDALHTRVAGGGSHVDLVLDHSSAAAFRSRGNYLFGSIGMRIKLAPGNSAGTVTAFYTQSDGDQHDEMDFEFLGNSSGEPYLLQTNVFANGQGNREQRISLWFDPTTDFHSYSLLWNHNLIVFYVDAVPVRVFRNNQDLGVPFPNKQGVGIHASLWDGSTWATQHGKVPLDWTSAPFVASFEGFGVDACQVWTEEFAGFCSAGVGFWWDTAPYQTLTLNQINQLHYTRQHYLDYDYCTDTERFPVPPVECASNWYEENSSQKNQKQGV